MEGNSTEVLADLERQYGDERQNNCDTPVPPRSRCEACGIRHFDHYRTIRGRAQWECVGCGAISEIPVGGESA